MEKFYTELQVEIKGVDEEKATLEAIFSTANEDRHGDVVLQNWDLKNFQANPVILNSHNYYDATEVIGRAIDIRVEDNKLQGKIEFAVNANPKAKIIYELYKGKFMKAFSVGFLVKKWNDLGQMLENELLEISAVSIPANAFALAKAKGIEVDKLYEHKNEQPITDDKPTKDGESEEIEGNNEDKNNEEGEDSEGIDDTGIGEGEEEETTEIEVDKKQLVLSKIAYAVKVLREKEKVGTPTQDEQVRAKNKRLIAKAVRELLKLNKNL